MSSTDRLPLPHNDLPPLPRLGETGPQVCATVRLYLAIVDDLTTEQVAILDEHVRICNECAKMQRLLRRTTHLFTMLPSSTPSNRVDQAVMTAIAARHSSRSTPLQFSGDPRVSKRRGQSDHSSTPTSIAAYTQRKSKSKHGVSFTRKPLAISITALAAVAMLFLIVGLALNFLGGFPPATRQAFHLPSNLSWSGYVLYFSETRLNTQGTHYHVNCYDDLSTSHMRVETVMAGSLDVVAVSDAQETLGLDMMHHVAQWGMTAWSVDKSIFNLTMLRNDLAANRAVYLDQDMFRGQAVYRIRNRDGLVLLLDMRYQPVNVLRGAIGPGTGEPVYDTLKMMSSGSVSDSMWNMAVPKGFKMGTLPARP